jgi:ring-1,2-phenylacetyl-CoA epoxidase subunit PaaE
VGTGAEVTITLDGRQSSFRLNPAGPPVLEAALLVRADAPFACKGGVCGTCRALVKEGTVDMRRNYALEEAETTAGFVLTCQSYPVSAEVSVDYDA